MFKYPKQPEVGEYSTQAVLRLAARHPNHVFSFKLSRAASYDGSEENMERVMVRGDQITQEFIDGLIEKAKEYTAEGNDDGNSFERIRCEDKPGPTEVMIESRVIDPYHPGAEFHIMQIDFLGEVTEQGLHNLRTEFYGLQLYRTTNSYHAIGPSLIQENIAQLISRLLLVKEASVDVRWAAHSLREGAFALRISNVGKHFPEFVKTI